MNGERTAYLSAGANLGDRQATLLAAVDDLVLKGISVRRVSSLYETEPVGYLDQPWFLNIAIQVGGSMSPRELLAACLDVETAHGRVRAFRDAPRFLDLDILLFEDRIVDEPGLQVPHPRMAERRFVLQPLAEIAPAVIHPVRQTSIRALLELCPDHSRVVRISGFPR